VRVTVPTPVAQQLCDGMKDAGIKVRRIPQPNNETEVALAVTNDDLNSCFLTLQDVAKALTEQYEAEQEPIEEIDDGRNTEPDPDPDPGDGPAGITPDDLTDPNALNPTPTG
jgi:hypothetical protein